MIQYIVQPGDTLELIAENFKVAMDNIIKENRLENNKKDQITPGIILQIPPE